MEAFMGSAMVSWSREDWEVSPRQRKKKYLVGERLSIVSKYFPIKAPSKKIKYYLAGGVMFCLHEHWGKINVF